MAVFIGKFYGHWKRFKWEKKKIIKGLQINKINNQNEKKQS
jgi:hypothetical protein